MPRENTFMYNLIRKTEKHLKVDMLFLINGGWWFSVGTGVLSFFALLLYVVFANFLSKDTYGTYQYLLSISSIIGAFTLTGMNSAVARAVAQGYEGTLKTAVQVQISFGIIPLILACVGSLYYFLNNNSVLGWGFLLIGIFTPLFNSFNTYGAYFHGKQDFRGSFIYGLFWHIPYYIALICAAFLSSGALMLLILNLAVQTVATFFLYKFVQRKLVTNNSDDPSAVSFGMHLSAMNLPNTIATQIDSVMVFTLLGATPLAIYSFATAIPERLVGFLKFLPAAALPKFSNKTSDEIRGALRGTRMLFLIAAILTCCVLYFLAVPYIFRFIFPEYLDSVLYTQWYSLIFFSVIGNLFVTGLTAERNIKNLYVFNLITPTVQTILQLLGVIFYGVAGLIAGRLLAMFISTIVSGYLLLSKAKRLNS